MSSWEHLVIKAEIGPISVQAHHLPDGWRQSVRWHGRETRFGGPYPATTDEILHANLMVLETELCNGDPISTEQYNVDCWVVPCSKCGAKAGQACQDARYKHQRRVLGDVHRERIQDWRAAIERGEVTEGDDDGQ